MQYNMQVLKPPIWGGLGGCFSSFFGGLGGVAFQVLGGWWVELAKVLGHQSVKNH